MGTVKEIGDANSGWLPKSLLTPQIDILQYGLHFSGNADRKRRQ